MIRLAALVCVLVSCLELQAGDAKKENELKWAKGVLSDFLQSAKAREFDQAEILMTKDLKDVMEKEVRNFLPGIRGWSNLNELDLATWTINGEEISPERDEAVFRGIFKKEQDMADFTFRVVKDKENSKWRINYVHCGKWAQAKSQPKKLN